MDAVIIIFFVVALYKYIFSKDKENKDLAWIGVGGLLVFIISILPTISLSTFFSIPITSFDPVLGSIYILAYIIILIGTLKLILSLIKRAGG
jgi:hypothetical protein